MTLKINIRYNPMIQKVVSLNQSSYNFRWLYFNEVLDEPFGNIVYLISFLIHAIAGAYSNEGGNRSLAPIQSFYDLDFGTKPTLLESLAESTLKVIAINIEKKYTEENKNDGWPSLSVVYS